MRGDIVLGKTIEGIECFLNEGINKGKINKINGRYYTGIKWECVEFLRRYLIITRGITFQKINSALELCILPYVIDISNGILKNIVHYKNGEIKIKKGDIIILNTTNNKNGHVVIVSKCIGNQIEIIEQNYDNKLWNGKNYSRKYNIKNNYIYSNNKDELVIDIIRIMK
jgi:hypothetical protein